MTLRGPPMHHKGFKVLTSVEFTEVVYDLARGGGEGQMVMATFPRAFPASRWRIASGTSASG
jgi:hypothetical protein